MRNMGVNPFEFGADGIGKFFVNFDGDIKEAKLSKDEEKAVEDAISKIISLAESLDNIEDNHEDEDTLKKENEIIDWIENNILNSEIPNGTSDREKEEILKLKKEVSEEIKAEKERIKKEMGKKDNFHCMFDDKADGALSAIEKMKNPEPPKQNTSKKNPIFLNGKPLNVREAPKYETVKFSDALEAERKRLKEAKEAPNKVLGEENPTLGLSSNKALRTFFQPCIDEDGKRCYVAYPFGECKLGKWSENVESIKVNDDEVVIQSRVKMENECVDMKETLSRVIRAKLPLDSDYSTVTAEKTKSGLKIKVLRKHFEKKEKYSVEIK